MISATEKYWMKQLILKTSRAENTKVQKYIFIFYYYFWTQRRHIEMKSFLLEDKGPLLSQIQYYAFHIARASVAKV